MLSVVIPAYNEEKAIGACLTSLTWQKTVHTFEVIVVDNNSTDDTAAVARSYRDKLNIRVIAEKHKGRGAARRTGFARAKGTIILGTDADTIVPTNWIEEMVKPILRDNRVAGTTGPSRINNCSTLTNAVFNASHATVMRIYRFMHGHFWLSGFSCAIRADAYKKTSGFDADLNAYEDIDIGFKISRVGEIRFVRTAPVLFSGRRFKKSLITGMLSYAGAYIHYFVFKNKSAFVSDIR